MNESIIAAGHPNNGVPPLGVGPHYRDAWLKTKTLFITIIINAIICNVIVVIDGITYPIVIGD